MESNSAVATPAPQWDFIVTGARQRYRANFREFFTKSMPSIANPGIELTLGFSLSPYFTA